MNYKKILETNNQNKTNNQDVTDIKSTINEKKIFESDTINFDTNQRNYKE